MTLLPLQAVASLTSGVICRVKTETPVVSAELDYSKSQYKTNVKSEYNFQITSQSAFHNPCSSLIMPNLKIDDCRNLTLMTPTKDAKMLANVTSNSPSQRIMFMFTHTIILHLVMRNKIDVISDYQKHVNYIRKGYSHSYL